MIAKVTLKVIHSGGRLSATTVNCGNLIITVWMSLRLSVVLRASLSTPYSKALISPHGKVRLQQATLTSDSNSFRIILGKGLRIRRVHALQETN